MDWAEAQGEDAEIEATADWCHLNKKKSEPWMEQLVKLKSRLGSKKNTPEGRSILWNADKLTLSGGLLYYRYKPKYQIEKVKCFVVPRAPKRTTTDGCHHKEKALMVPMMITATLHLVHLYFTSFETTTNLNESPKGKHIMVIVDHFMRYTRAHVTKDQKASTAAKTLYEGFISIF